MRVGTTCIAVQCALAALLAAKHANAFINPVHTAAAAAGAATAKSLRHALAPLQVMPMHLIHGGSDSWATPGVGDSSSGITILDRETEVSQCAPQEPAHFLITKLLKQSQLNVALEPVCSQHGIAASLAVVAAVVAEAAALITFSLFCCAAADPYQRQLWRS
jgi:hypothetical protein